MVPVTEKNASRRVGCALFVSLSMLLAACAPVLDWRTVALPDSELLTQLPCRPSSFQRTVEVAGEPMTLFMLSCEAGGVTYGLSTAEVGDPARVDAVLHALVASARAAIRAGAADALPFQIPGATPFSGSLSTHLDGSRPDGQAVEESLRVFARGTRVFQMAALGRALPDASILPFEQGLRFDLSRRGGSP